MNFSMGVEDGGERARKASQPHRPWPTVVLAGVPRRSSKRQRPVLPERQRQPAQIEVHDQPGLSARELEHRALLIGQDDRRGPRMIAAPALPAP